MSSRNSFIVLFFSAAADDAALVVVTAAFLCWLLHFCFTIFFLLIFFSQTCYRRNRKPLHKTDQVHNHVLYSSSFYRRRRLFQNERRYYALFFGNGTSYNYIVSKWGLPNLALFNTIWETTVWWCVKIRTGSITYICTPIITFCLLTRNLEVSKQETVHRNEEAFMYHWAFRVAGYCIYCC